MVGRVASTGMWGRTHKVDIAQAPRAGRHASAPIYETKLGAAHHGDSLRVLKSKRWARYEGQVQLVFTSPPFPLNTKKRYGNLQGDEYIRWFAKFAPLLRRMVSNDGSIVVEIGNAWMPGEPVMSTHVLEAFLKFLEKGDLYLCQEFIWYNPARLPSPVEWVNRERIRVKDAFTRIWWMSPSPRPKADNRKVLREYSPSMKRLIETGKYNAGARPSEYNIGKHSFKADNQGAIPPNVGGTEALPSIDEIITPRAFVEYLEQSTSLLKAANTVSTDGYRRFCIEKGAPVHPARMPASLVEFFVKFLTDTGDIVLDPFAGSNTTGAVAESWGRRWLSIEAEWNYAAHSIGRFDPRMISRTCKDITIEALDSDVSKDESTKDYAKASSDCMAPLFTS